MQSESFHTDVAEFSQALGILMRRVRATSAALGISWTQVAVLGRLYRDGPATVSDLARAEGMKSQSMGASITVLEEMGMVERQPHPTDGRQVNIVLTEKGIAMREEIRTSKRAWLAQAIAQLDDDQQKTLFAATKIIQRLGEL